MRKRFLLLAAIVCLAAIPTVALAEPTTFYADPVHSSVGFSVRHFVSEVDGRFNQAQGVIVYDPANPAKSSVEFKVSVKSIDTGVKDRDDHLRSADFFDADKQPAMSFKSSSVKKLDDKTLEVSGDLTLRGVTKPQTVRVKLAGPLENPLNGVTMGFRTEFEINRTDYGVNFNQVLDQGLKVIGEEVTVKVSVEAHTYTGKRSKPAIYP